MDIKELETFRWCKLVVTSRSVIPVIHQLCLLTSHSVSHKKKVNGKRNRKHKCKKLWFPSPAFVIEEQYFISVVKVIAEGDFPCLSEESFRG